MKVYNMPTGKICVDDFSLGKLEFLSLGDYGRNKNVKADFLGLYDEINGVPNGDIMPLTEKWVVTISTQYGCSMGCKFCDVPHVGPGINAKAVDLLDQVKSALSLDPEIKKTKRLNVHFARMGEPTFNPNVLCFTKIMKDALRPHIGDSLIHPVVSTMMPKKNKNLLSFLEKWVEIKNEDFKGDAGLQFSINSTSDDMRNEMFGGSTLSLEEIAEIGEILPIPKGRKYTLNFALADGFDVDPFILWDLFDPNKFMVKITPIHVTNSSIQNGIKTSGGYDTFKPFYTIERELVDIGFDVIVFIPSYDEDLGMITCGNAILSGRKPQVEYTVSEFIKQEECL